MTSSESDIPEQGPVLYFQGASNFVVSDSHFTEVRGNGNVTTTTTTIIHNHNHTYTFPPDPSSVSNLAAQDAPSSSVVIQRPDPKSELLEAFAALLASSRDNEDTSYHWGRIEGMFEDVDRRLTPYSRTLLKRLRQDVGDLKDVAFFTYQAYRACLGSRMGVLVRGHIKRQITACGATIKRVQQKIIDILEGWVPVWTLFDRYLPAAFAGAFLSEPDDIAAVRKDVLGEMQSLGEIVRSLELIESWARDLFPAPIAIGAVLFSISDINKWLERSPNLLHHIKVDQIYVVEPLGDRLAIPTRFIESSEQIHMCLQLKCQKTHGAGYIDNRQYQLNESASDLAVDEKGLQSYIRGTGVQLEVTVFVQSARIEPNRCPRPVCGFLNKSGSVNGWMRCQMCQKKISTQEVGWTTSQVTDRQDPPSGSTTYPAATATKEDSTRHAFSRLNRSELPVGKNKTQDSTMQHRKVVSMAEVSQSWSLFHRIMVQLPKASNRHIETQTSVSGLDYALHPATAVKPDLPGRLMNLGNSFQRRFTGILSDIDEAIASQESVIRLTPPGHVDLPAFLNNLGSLFKSRSELTGNPFDIDEAIASLTRAVELTPAGHAGLPAVLNNLGSSFQSRFELTGNPSDIDEAITSLERAVELTPAGDAGLPAVLNNLGSSFQSRFEITGNRSDIDEAITSLTRAVELTPAGHAGLPGRLNNLGSSFQSRFERTGNRSDIYQAITSLSRAVELTPPGDAGLPGRLNNLGSSFQSRFERTGNRSDIYQAIASLSRAVELTPPGDAGLPAFLNNLGPSFLSRFELTGNPSDIDEAITFLTRAVELTPAGHAGLPGRLNNLGSSFQSRFERTGNPFDINEAIATLERAVELTPPGHAGLPASLNNLGSSFQSRFKLTGNPSDINEAIASLERAINLTPPSHVDLPAFLRNLESSLRHLE